jgi:hypothetical protein
MAVSPGSLFAALVSTDIWRFSGERSISEPLEDSYLLMALVRVVTILQLFGVR